MELRKLRYFARVAEDGSLTRSAGILRIAQPALSRQMRLLEEELGVKLFTRTSRGMQLTEEGTHLHAAIAVPLRELEMAIDNVRAASLQPVGNLVVGLPPGLAELLALPIAELMTRDFPGLILRLVEGPTGSIADWLNRGAVDIALLEEETRDNRLDDRLVCEQPLWLVGTADTHLAQRKTISFAQAAALPLVIPSHHMGIKGAIDDAAGQAGLALNARIYADAPSLMRRLIDSGQGYGILPEAYCRNDIMAGRMSGCRIVDPPLKIGIFLTTRRRGRVTVDRIAAIQAALIDLAKAQLTKGEG